MKTLGIPYDHWELKWIPLTQLFLSVLSAPNKRENTRQAHLSFHPSIYPLTQLYSRSKTLSYTMFDN